MSHEFQELEDGLLAVLAPLKEAQGVRTLEAYAGQFLDLDDLVKMARRFPAVFVICDGLKIEPSNRVDKARVEFRVIVADRHLRGPAGASRGDGSGPGAYGLLTAVRALVNGRPPAPGWQAAKWKGDEPVFVGPADSVAVFESDYETRIALRR